MLTNPHDAESLSHTAEFSEQLGAAGSIVAVALARLGRTPRPSQTGTTSR